METAEESLEVIVSERNRKEAHHHLPKHLTENIQYFILYFFNEVMILKITPKTHISGSCILYRDDVLWIWFFIL